MHWEAVKQVICYLKAMKDTKLTLESMNAGLKAYIDLDWASQAHHHFIFRYVILLNDRPVI